MIACAENGGRSVGRRGNSNRRAAETDAAQDIRTTMNLCGDVVTDEMAQAHSKVVGLALSNSD
jgi:hypothetical protein